MNHEYSLTDLDLPGRCPVCRREVRVAYERFAVAWTLSGTNHVRFKAKSSDYPVHSQCQELFQRMKISLSTSKARIVA